MMDMGDSSLTKIDMFQTYLMELLSDVLAGASRRGNVKKEFGNIRLFYTENGIKNGE
ncbi:MAG: hypothetical protein IKU73_07605 [Clostridia bacterium]|nr:hypothetical protein [Clostridia bacterium]